MEKELWKPLKNFEGLYEINKKGEIKSLDKIIERRNQFKSYKQKYKGQEIKPFDNGNGYLQITLKDKNNCNKKKYIHRLIYETFVENIPHSKEINHIDHDKKNNNIENLEVVTRAENMQKKNNFYKIKRRKFVCDNCNKKLNFKSKSNLCRECYCVSIRKIKRPDLEALKKEIEEVGFEATGRKYGVSGNSIRKWIKTKK